jgi:protein SCO1/2
MADQRGKVVLVTFLYTNCPDVCPLITQNLNQPCRCSAPSATTCACSPSASIRRATRRKAVDAYAKAHHLLPEFHYLIGTRDELTEVWKNYDVAAVASDPGARRPHGLHDARGQNGDGRVIYDSSVKAKDVVHDVDELLSS